MEENKDTPVAADQPISPVIPTENPDGQKIGGWLILLAIGVVLTPFRIGIALVSIFKNVSAPGVWAAITTPGTEAYHPLWQPVIASEISINIILIIASIVLAVFFFMRKKFVPTFFIIYLIFNAVFVCLDFFISDMIPAVQAQQANDTETIRTLIQSIVVCFIWVPYFIVSKRVKKTFVK